MRAVVADEAGGPEVLRVVERPDPEPGVGQVLLDVEATAVNGADLLQRRGLYPVPPGVTDVLGLECSGTVAAVGPGVDGLAVGDEVCALLDGGGYATRVVVSAGQVMPRPGGVDAVGAAALPEVAATVWSNLVGVAGLRAGQRLLVHGGTSGIGTHAVQVARALGAWCAVTVGTPDKAGAARAFDPDAVVVYRDDDWTEQVRDATGGRGVDVVLDPVGGRYLDAHLRLLAPDGHLVVIGLKGGTRGEVDLARLLTGRLSVSGTTLRGRPAEQKADVCAEVVRHVWPRVAAGDVRPVVDRVLALDDVAEAHRVVEAGEHVGKVVLAVG